MRLSSFVLFSFFIGLAIASRTWGQTVAYYRFEEGTAGQTASATGGVLDSSGNGFNGTGENNGPVYSSNVPVSTVPQTGAPDNLSMSFSGTNNQSVFIPENSAFDLTHSLTMEAYVDVFGVPNASGNIFYRGDNVAGDVPYGLNVETQGNKPLARFYINPSNFGNGQQVLVSAPLPAYNQWVFLAATLNDATNTMSLYINGTLAASTITTERPMGSMPANQDPGSAIGGLQSNAFGDLEAFDGLIDEVRLSNVALTPSQFLDATAVPEPASLGLIGLSAAGLLMRRRKA